MSLFALIAALLLEQLKPLCSRKHLYGWLSGYVEYFQHHFNSGEYSHGKTAWWLAVLPMLVGTVLAYWGLSYINPILSILFNILALYLCMGFGLFSHGFTDIQLALRSGRLDEAHTLLSSLRGRASGELNAEEVARVTIEVSLIEILQHLFGVIVWFVLFSLAGMGGAAGALLYCLSLKLGKHWVGEFGADGSGEAKFNGFACEMAARLTWLPIRLTAATFAIVGNFEDTVYCWRSQAALWSDSEAGILLASAAGASGVRLGLPIHQDGVLADRPELGVGDKRNDAAMQCAIRLVWRSVLFMMVTLFMLTLAGLLR
ncbi:MAG: CobD/CbiB family protein [Proteobacteria bacterium]|nr:CobD/CbiB family protein [Pseudomonadota bacterium]